MEKEKVRYHYGKKHPYLTLFHENSGVYVRTGLREAGSGTDQDPFMADFPETLQIDIMGHGMPFADFQQIIRACEGKTYQITLQGRKDPDQHPDFADMVEYSRRHGIVPNIITSGLGMTAELAKICGTYCGTAAVRGMYCGTAAVCGIHSGTAAVCDTCGGITAGSCCRKSTAHKAVELLLQAGVRTDLHYILSAATIQEAVRLLKTNGFPAGIHAVFFQLYKPSGYGRKEQILTTGMPLLQAFFRLVDNGGFPFQVGFEPCMVPGILWHTRNIEPERLDACEGGRWSAYISPDLYLMPCSFTDRDLRFAVSLKEHTIEEAWNSSAFDRFRSQLKNACPDCTKRENCMGGCPVFPEIVLCGQNARRNT